MIQGSIAEIRRPRKTLITLERNKLERSALCRSKENSFFYRILKPTIQINREITPENRFQNVHREKTWLVHCKPIRFQPWFMPPGLLFLMVKTAALYLVPTKSYSKNGHSPFIFFRTIDLRTTNRLNSENEWNQQTSTDLLVWFHFCNRLSFHSNSLWHHYNLQNTSKN